MSSVVGLLVLSTSESDNNCETKQDREGQDAPLYNLGGDPARLVYNVVFCTPLTMETEGKS
eukprot:1225029-Ditylum_brightwellii.AAC.2